MLTHGLDRSFMTHGRGGLGCCFSRPSNFLNIGMCGENGFKFGFIHHCWCTPLSETRCGIFGKISCSVAAANTVLREAGASCLVALRPKKTVVPSVFVTPGNGFHYVTRKQGTRSAPQ